MMIRLMVFLGNPGKKFEKTRHNAGWLILPYIRFDSPPVFRKKFNGEYALARIAGKQVHILKPTALMNNSGKSVLACMNFFKMAPGEMLVVHDDLELDFGDIRVKAGGGLGGHNGLKSIVQSVGGGEFHRLRFGISRPSRGSVSSYVLSRFSQNEETELNELLRSAAAHIISYVTN